MRFVVSRPYDPLCGTQALRHLRGETFVTFTEYENKRVVVTGCSSGIGLAVANALVDQGAEVIGMSRRAPDLNLAEFHRLDLASVKSIESAAVSLEGPVDALFNCAGAPPILPSIELVKV